MVSISAMKPHGANGWGIQMDLILYHKLYLEIPGVQPFEHLNQRALRSGAQKLDLSESCAAGRVFQI
jgi:hypothetical protein